jgi:membrane-bound lytic murein transglycosylase D
LAAYNGGPGYIQRKLISTGKNNFWELQPYLRRETRNYVPKFIAVTYLMHYHKEYNIVPDSMRIVLQEKDTLRVNHQIDFTTLSELACLSKEEISHYNPSYKNEVFPKNAIINLPSTVIDDYLLNHESYKLFSEAVERKEILIDETRFVYLVEPGDYLGKIASTFKLKIFQIQKWNNLKSTKLDVGDRLILYVANSVFEEINLLEPSNSSYIVRKGDTLWDIARMYHGITVSKIKKLNNLKTNSLKPGLKLLIPKA